MMNLFKQFIWFLRDYLKFRHIIFELAKKDFKNKFLGSYFGTIWAFINPIINILIIWYVFQVAFNTKKIDNYPFILWLMPAMILWSYFAESLSTATNSILENRNTVKKIVFRVSTLPVTKIMSALFIHLIFIFLVIIIYAIYGYHFEIYMFQFFYYVFCSIVLFLGLSWITSSIVVFFRDTTQIVIIILQFGFWLTPIFWSLKILPAGYSRLFKLNPICYISEGYRSTLLYKVWFWEHLNWTIYYWFVTSVIFIIGALIFNRLRPHFADIL